MRKPGRVRPVGRRRVSARWLAALVLLGLAAVVVAVVLVAQRYLPPLPPSARLDRLTVVERTTADPSYRRAEFGESWADLDSDGCNTRDEVLLATVDRSKSYQTQRQGRCRADMVAGTWVDMYTGALMTWSNLKEPVQAQGIPIDHIVSLAGAYRYGARDWTDQQRVEFANDELNLTPTTAALNRAKTDSDPASWTPPPAGRCAYATRYIAVKSKYDLPVDPEEKAALQGLLDSCPA